MKRFLEAVLETVKEDPVEAALFVGWLLALAGIVAIGLYWPI